MTTILREKQIQALQGSVEKWRRIINREDVDRGTENCACCQEFGPDDDCRGCPIFADTRRAYCDNTPYQAWTEYFNAFLGFDEDSQEWVYRDDETGFLSEYEAVYDERTRLLAVAEFEYLSKLLEKLRSEDCYE